MRIVADKLYRSLKKRDPEDRVWFQEALSMASDHGLALDDVIWEAVREILDELEYRNRAE